MVFLIATSLIAILITGALTSIEFSRRSGGEPGLVTLAFLSVIGLNVVASIAYEGKAEREVVKHEVVKVENIGDVYRLTLEDGTKKVLEGSNFTVTVGSNNTLTEKKALSDTYLFDMTNATYELEISPGLAP